MNKDIISLSKHEVDLMTFFWKEKEDVTFTTIQCWGEKLGWNEFHLQHVLATLTRKGMISFLEVEDKIMFCSLISQKDYYTQLAGLNRNRKSYFFEKTAIAKRLRRHRAERRKDVLCELEKIIQGLSEDSEWMLSEEGKEDTKSEE